MFSFGRQHSFAWATAAKKVPAAPHISFLTNQRKEGMGEKEWIQKGEPRERHDDITGGLTCMRVEVLTSTVTGRGRTSIPYVGHIKNTCSCNKSIQLTEQAVRQLWNRHCHWTSSFPWLCKFQHHFGLFRLMQAEGATEHSVSIIY